MDDMYVKPHLLNKIIILSMYNQYKLINDENKDLDILKINKNDDQT